MKNKQPPFQITNKMIADVAEISELTGRLSAHDHLSSNPNLRRTKIRYSGTAIEHQLASAFKAHCRSRRHAYEWLGD